MDYIQIITQVGFPIFVCLYFMFRMEKVLKHNTIAISELLREVKNGRRRRK